MQLVSGIDASDRLSARYVSQGGWSPLWLPGRTVSTARAISAIRAAEELRREPSPDDQAWTVIRDGAEALGLTLREFCQLFDVECEIPSVSPERNMLWGMRFPERVRWGWR